MPPKSSPKPKVQPPSVWNPQAVVTIYITTHKTEFSNRPKVIDDFLRMNCTTHLTLSPKTSKFMVHKDFICYYSPFFKAAFDGNFSEGKSQEMSLEADSVAFGVVVSWFYTQRFVNSDDIEPDLVTLTRSWILAEHFKMPKLQNHIMAEIHSTLLYINCAGYPHDNFENFAKIAFNHGNGENQLVEVGAWAIAWADKDFMDHLSDER